MVKLEDWAYLQSQITYLVGANSVVGNSSKEKVKRRR